MNKLELSNMSWFQELCEEVNHASKELLKQQDGKAAGLAAERKDLERQVKGWSQSLADPDLPANVRADIGQQYARALTRINAIDALVSEAMAVSELQSAMIDPAVVSEYLTRLEEVLSGTNPSHGNMELAHHIDRINCFDSGEVVIRTCKLGALAGAVDLFRSDDEAAIECKPTTNANSRRKSRRLTRRRIVSPGRQTMEMKSRVTFATNPNRFAGLDERWFDAIVLHVPRTLSWAEKNAPQVAFYRKQNLTEQQLADRFGVTVPTIRKALRFARKTDPALLSLPRRMPRSKWHEENSLEVARLKAEGWSTVKLTEHFGKSETTIRSAMKHAEFLATATLAAPDVQ